MIQWILCSKQYRTKKRLARQSSKHIIFIKEPNDFQEYKEAFRKSLPENLRMDTMHNIDEDAGAKSKSSSSKKDFVMQVIAPLQTVQESVLLLTTALKERVAEQKERAAEQKKRSTENEKQQRLEYLSGLCQRTDLPANIIQAARNEYIKMLEADLNISHPAAPTE
jgi:hypothetical protein